MTPQASSTTVVESSTVAMGLHLLESAEFEHRGLSECCTPHPGMTRLISRRFSRPEQAVCLYPRPCSAGGERYKRVFVRWKTAANKFDSHLRHLPSYRTSACSSFLLYSALLSPMLRQ